MGYTPPHTLYNSEQIIGEKTYRVGVVLVPDQTNPSYAIPAIFEKKLSIWRSFSLTGDIRIGDEVIYDTGTYTGGWDALELLLSKEKKLGTGVARLTITVTDTPIVLVKSIEDEHRIWRSARKFHYAPNTWFDVSTEEGIKFFESEVDRRSLPDFTVSSEDRYENLEKFSIRPEPKSIVVYDSTRTLEENTQVMVDFMVENNWDSDEQKARITLHELFLAQLTEQTGDE